MLGKLIKHEFKATWKVLGLLDGALVVLGLIGFLVMGTMKGFLESNSGNNGLSGLIVASYITWFILYFLAIFAANLGTTIYLTIRYYRSMYSTEGYLTFTLPVRTGDLLHARMISGIVWSLLSFTLTAVSIFFMCTGFVSQLPPDEQAEIFEGFAEILDVINGGTIALALFTGIFSVVQGLLFLYFCVSVGQLWQKHKIAGAVLCFIITNAVTRTVMSIATIGRMFAITSFMQFDIENYYNGTLIITLVYSLLTGVIFYLVIRYINEHRVNLDG